MDEKYIADAIAALAGKFPLDERARIETGVRQAAKLWRRDDGGGDDFIAFCSGNFFSGEKLDILFSRFEAKLEALCGHFNAMQIALRLEADEDRGGMHPLDAAFAAFTPSAHLEEDLFAAKLAFAALLNFPVKTLEECLALGVKWNRDEWARMRLAGQFVSRVPPELKQAEAEAASAAGNYINSHGIRMDRVAGPDGAPAFRQGLRLLPHWGLRDEIKALYADPAGLEKQKLIHDIMLRVITQEIPRAAAEGGEGLWDPAANTLDGAPAPAEPDTRYGHLLAVFNSCRRQDRYYPDFPTHMDRRFKLGREIPESEARALFETLLDAPVSAKIAARISERLGRRLLPFDIWYDGFKKRGSIPQAELDARTAAKYPTLEAFGKDIGAALGALGFSPETAAFLAGHIEAAPARGAGHAWPPLMRGANAVLRARVPPGGMDYKGFNIAMHELGHCVEQVFSLYKTDHYLLRGVPNTAFSEAFAFLFQSRDLEILGLARHGSSADALDEFWAAREIAAVALVDMDVWRWLYRHPRATPEKLKAAAINIAKGIWNRHNAAVFGVKDSPLLSAYSHMINGALYLPDYPLGRIIASQIGAHFDDRPLAQEMERMCAIGALTPAEWMRQAVGSGISALPLVAAAENALL